MNNWRENELSHLDSLWDTRPKKKMDHSQKAWNDRAHEWEKGLRESVSKNDTSNMRIHAVCDYLINKGVVNSDTEMIDIGCGPGRFVCEFAKTARWVTGLDLSEEMTRYGIEFCKKEGRTNTDFIACDFIALDVEKEGYINKYDFVFSSITPAIGYKEGYKKALSMSKEWFFNACFVDVYDTVQNELERNLNVSGERFGSESGFYCMFNDMFLNGYFPEVTYYTEEEADCLGFEKAVRKYSRTLFGCDYKKDEEQKVRKLLENMVDESGNIHTLKKQVYALTLVNKKRRKSSYKEHND